MQDDRNRLIPEKKRRKRKVSAPVVLALEALASGRARTITEAASMAAITPHWLGRMLRRPEIGVMVDEMSRKLLRVGKLRASNRVVELLDHASGKVSLEASRFVLGVGGISPPRDGVTVNVSGAGYIVDFSTKGNTDVLSNIDAVGGVIFDRPGAIIDQAPNAEHASAPALAAPKGYER